MQGREDRYSVPQLHTLWASGASYREIAAALGCSQSFVCVLKNRHKLPKRKRMVREVFEDDPTPEQIAERAAECRAKWHTAEPRGERYSVPRYTWDGYGFRGIV